jgi:hypothetical protein
MSGNNGARTIEVEFDEYIGIRGIMMFSHKYKVMLTSDEKDELDRINAEVERSDLAKENSQKALNEFERECKEKSIKIFDFPDLKPKWHQLIEINIQKNAEYISALSKLNGFRYRFRGSHPTEKGAEG